MAAGLTQAFIFAAVSYRLNLVRHCPLWKSFAANRDKGIVWVNQGKRSKESEIQQVHAKERWWSPQSMRGGIPVISRLIS